MIYRIDSLNYASSGDRRGMVNIDYSLDVSSNFLLRTEDGSEVSGVSTEEGNGDLSAIQVQGRYIDAANVKETARNRSFVFDRDQRTLSGSLNVLVRDDQTQKNLRIAPLYDAKDLMYKSPIDKVNKENEVLPETDRKVDIYAPRQDEDPIGFCNFDDRTILITSGGSSGPRYIDTSFRETRGGLLGKSTSYTTKIAEKRRNEYSYPVPSSLLSTATSYGEYLSSLSAETEEAYLSGFYEIFRQDVSNLGVRCQNVLDVEQSVEPLDFRSGNAYATSNPVKAIYDGTYTTEGGNFDLSSAREYVGIMESGGNVYLKFRDDVGYPTGVSPEEGDVETVNPEPSIRKYSYQKIERYNPTKVASTARHKSNLFSVRILNSGIGDGNQDDGLSSLRLDIENAVREIVRNISPVNTQLFKVYFEDNAK